MVRVNQVVCPKCKQLIWIDSENGTVICGKCGGVVLVDEAITNSNLYYAPSTKKQKFKKVLSGVITFLLVLAIVIGLVEAGMDIKERQIEREAENATFRESIVDHALLIRERELEIINSFGIEAVKTEDGDEELKEIAVDMMSDYMKDKFPQEKFYYLGKCFMDNDGYFDEGFVFILGDLNNPNLGCFFYAVPEDEKMYACNVGSEFYLCWCDGYSIDYNKAETFIKNIIGYQLEVFNVDFDGYYLFWYNNESYNNEIIYVNTACTAVYIENENGVKVKVYPDNTLNFFE